MDPQVWVEIHGVAIDNAKQKTQRIDNNGNSEFPFKQQPLFIRYIDVVSRIFHAGLLSEVITLG